jgi:hypothetical protein
MFRPVLEARHVLSRTVFAVACLLALSSCGGDGDGVASPSSSTTSTSETTTTTQPEGAGPHRPGDCLVIGNGLEEISCDRPHEYEVTLSGDLPPEARNSYPPSSEPTIGPTCWSSRSEYLGSPDADATRLDSSVLWPTQEQWDAGDRWFACVVSDPGTDEAPDQRTGSVADALADGLGTFQECFVDEPEPGGPNQVTSCDEPHRSEAVPGVLALGDPSGPPPDVVQVVADRAVPHCEEAVREYLGGDRPDVSPHLLAPRPDQWSYSAYTAVCYAVSDEPVTGPLVEP